MLNRSDDLSRLDSGYARPRVATAIRLLNSFFFMIIHLVRISLMYFSIIALKREMISLHLVIEYNNNTYFWDSTIV